MLGGWAVAVDAVEGVTDEVVVEDPVDELVLDGVEVGGCMLVTSS